MGAQVGCRHKKFSHLLTTAQVSLKKRLLHGAQLLGFIFKSQFTKHL